MTPERLAELKALCDARLKGEWDLRSILVSDVRWLIVEVERLMEIRGIVEHFFSPEIIGDEADKSIALLAISSALEDTP
jgi:hypothetical protein